MVAEADVIVVEAGDHWVREKVKIIAASLPGVWTVDGGRWTVDGANIGYRLSEAGGATPLKCRVFRWMAL